MKIASRFGRINQIRRDRPLTKDELMAHVPSVSGIIRLRTFTKMSSSAFVTIRKALRTWPSSVWN